MFKKLKKYFRKKLISFLRIDEKIKKLTERINNLENDVRCNEREIGILKDEFSVIVDISADVDIDRIGENNSWAIISIKGKNDYVRFIDLRDFQVRKIITFLKRFENCNKTINTPFHMRGYFKEEFKKEFDVKYL